MREPAQSKCTWTFHKSHVAGEFSGTMRGHTIVTHTLCKPAQSKCTWTYHKSQFMREFTGKMLQTTRARLCASLRNQNALGRLTGAKLYARILRKMPRSTMGPTLRASLCSRNALAHVSRARITNKMPGPMEHPDQALACTLTVKTRECGHTIWGIIGKFTVPACSSP